MCLPSKSSRLEVFRKTSSGVVLRWPAALFKKKTLEQVFSCEFREISKNFFFHLTSLVAASVYF